MWKACFSFFFLLCHGQSLSLPNCVAILWTVVPVYNWWTVSSLFRCWTFFYFHDVQWLLLLYYENICSCIFTLELFMQYQTKTECEMSKCYNIECLYWETWYDLFLLECVFLFLRAQYVWVVLVSCTIIRL